MSKGYEVAQDLKDARRELYDGVNFFGGGNVGEALKGKYMAESLNKLTEAIEKLAERPIIVNVNLPKKSSTNRPKSTTKESREK
jgi:hypothetical protein